MLCLIYFFVFYFLCFFKLLTTLCFQEALETAGKSALLKALLPISITYLFDGHNAHSIFVEKTKILSLF